MSKEVISQILKQTCEGCGKSVDWQLCGADDNPNMLNEMQQWFVVGRKIVNKHDQLVAISGDACSVTCVAVVAVKLSNPEASSDTNKIDLSSLRAGNLDAN